LFDRGTHHLLDAGSVWNGDEAFASPTPAIKAWTPSFVEYHIARPKDLGPELDEAKVLQRHARAPRQETRGVDHDTPACQHVRRLNSTQPKPKCKQNSKDTETGAHFLKHPDNRDWMYGTRIRRWW